MLKLVQNQKLGLHSIHAEEVETNPSLQFIDELIMQDQAEKLAAGA